VFETGAMGTLATGARKVVVSTQVTQAPHEILGLTPDHLLRMHRSMVTARLIDEASLRQNRMGRAPFVVPVSGHEGCQIGTAAAMVPGVDVWVPYYRDLGVVLVAGLTPYEVFLGVFSKADDPSSGGRQMPSHWSARRLGIVSHSSPIATQVPHATGIAYAMRYRDEQAAVGCWFGEGATSEGDWHEGLNFAAIHKLPVLFVCENNEYAISVRQDKQMAVRDVASRAAGYGMPGEVVDGSDVLACYAAMRSARERALAGEGPTLIECKTYRYLPHTSDDDDKSYRPRSEVDEHRHSDPIDRFAAYLLEHQLADAAALEAMRVEVVAEVEAAITAAWDAPDPDPATAMRNVLADEDEPAPS
jgi:2-oxoisovalerate dehydrogenase E1 component alpha subunit